MPRERFSPSSRRQHHGGALRGWLPLILAALILPVTDAAHAQLPGLLEQRRPSERTLPLPEYEHPEQVLPPLRPLPPEQRQAPSTGIRIFVRKFRFTGNTVFSDAELDKIAAPFENRAIGNEDLDELRQRLTLYYVNHGYINSGAVIPDQKVENGVIRIQIVEGQLSGIQVKGNKRLRSKYVTERLAFGAGPPLNINELREQLQIMLQDPALERVSADLRPGDRPGEANLLVNMEDAPLVSVTSTFDNHLSPSLGAVEGRVFATLHDPTGWGDTLSTEGDFAEGLTDFSANYTIPITKWDTALTFSGETIESQVVQSPFDELDIRSQYWSAGGEISQPVYRTPRDEVTLGLAFERRQARTYIFGHEGFAFSPGVEPDGRSKISVLRFAQNWVRRGLSRVVAARSTLSFGIDVFNPTINSGDVPDGRFFSWLGQFQWAERLSEARGDQVLFRLDGQLANQALLPMEQFSVGGADSVRGYRENQLVRDRGFDVSLEYRYPVLRNFFQDSAGRPTLQLAAFADAGGAWFINGNTPDPKIIASVGPGVRWDPLPKVHAQFYWGYALKNVHNPGYSIQDSGIHFLLRISPSLPGRPYSSERPSKPRATWFGR
jgi:hemolysin activation/secretion protein